MYGDFCVGELCKRDVLVVFMQGAGMTKIPVQKLTHSSCRCFYGVNTMKVDINLWKPTTT